jgi:hypothetical protein
MSQPTTVLHKGGKGKRGWEEEEEGAPRGIRESERTLTTVRSRNRSARAATLDGPQFLAKPNSAVAFYIISDDELLPRAQ